MGLKRYSATPKNKKGKRGHVNNRVIASESWKGKRKSDADSISNPRFALYNLR